MCHLVGFHIGVGRRVRGVEVIQDVFERSAPLLGRMDGV